MYMNAGGAVATLSFIGALPEARGALSSKVALSLFFIGVVCSGMLIVLAAPSLSKKTIAFFANQFGLEKEDFRSHQRAAHWA